MTIILLKTLVFGMMIPGTVIILFPYLILSLTFWAFRCDLGRIRLVGVVPIVLGAGVMLWCWWDFFRKGKGTPSPTDPPTYLVTTGLYDVVRNPMYGGITCILFGEAVFFESLLLLVYGSLVVFLFHLFIRLYEEPVLARTFGAAYTAYCDRVPRWIPSRRSFRNLWKPVSRLSSLFVI